MRLKEEKLDFYNYLKEAEEKALKTDNKECAKDIGYYMRELLEMGSYNDLNFLFGEPILDIKQRIEKKLGENI